MVTAAVAAWTGNLDKIFGFVQKYLLPRKAEITEEQQQKLRGQLIEVVLKQVVKRLEDSLHHKIRMDLRREEQRQRVGRRDLPLVQVQDSPGNFIRRLYNPFRSSTPPKEVSAEKSTLELFEQDDIQGRLLILGEPGSGKTNELLVLARDLLQKARRLPEQPIPVIFELSEWQGEQAFADWLSRQLLEKYNVPVVVSQYWIKHRQLLPLLDGLDELRRVDEDDEATAQELDKRRLAKQIQCVRKINTFLDIYALPLVVCCRRKEYEAIETQGEFLKRLNGAIYLKELSNKQIQDYLQRSSREQLWNTLQHNLELLALARSPFFLLILVVAYQGQSIHNTRDLLDAYIRKQLYDLSNRDAYPPGEAPTLKQTHHYLSWLATKLEVVGTTEFLIERLQPSWLDTSKARELYASISGMIFGLTIGLMLGLVFGIIYGLTGGLIPGLLFGLSLGLTYGLIGGLLGWQRTWSAGCSTIKMSEKLSFSWKSFYETVMSIGLSMGLSIGLFVGPIGGVLVGLNSGVLFGLYSGILIGLISGLLGGLLGGLSIGLLYGLQTAEIDVRDKISPNQGTRDSIRNGLLGGLLYGLLGGLLGGLSAGLVRGWSAGLLGGLLVGWSAGLLGGLLGGFAAVCLHICLRVVLFQSGVSPWNYKKLLDHAENHRFIQRVGGRYRFVHDLLRKRFAETYDGPKLSPGQTRRTA